jgi:hypothetical protein
MINDNQTTQHGDGGGINVSGHLILTRSTVAGNNARRSGGGILANALTVVQSTISGNSAGSGGGVAGAGKFRFSTITDNVGGGIVGNAELDHSIVAGNRDGNGAPLDVAGVVNSRYSLVGFGAEYLGPLADNGGPTLPDGSRILTHALLTGSPAIDAGDPSAQAGVDGVPVHDQRGAPFTRVFGGRIDIGAFEWQPPGFLLGDYNQNGGVDAADYSVWRDAMGSSALAAGTGADGNGDGVVDSWDYRLWKSNFGATLDALAGNGPGAGGLEQGAGSVVLGVTEISTLQIGSRPLATTADQSDASAPARHPSRPLGDGETRAPRRLHFDPAGRHDRLIEAWLARHERRREKSDGTPAENPRSDAEPTTAVDEAFAVLEAGLN